MAEDKDTAGTAPGGAPVLNGTLAPLIPALFRDTAFAQLAEDGSDFSLVGAPAGIRPALAAATAEGMPASAADAADSSEVGSDSGSGRPVVIVVPSNREAQDMVGSVRSWYSGDPGDIGSITDWETLPHERLSPRADTVARRMSVFRRLAHPVEGSSLFGPLKVIAVPVRSLIQPVVRGIQDVEPLVFTAGGQMGLDWAASRLVENAYTRTDLVMDRGEFAVRGGILDIFPPTAAHPVRIDFFGDDIDSIHAFHASDQRTFGENIHQIWAPACRELQLTESVRRRAEALAGSIPNADDMLESIARGVPVEGMESLIPALIDDMMPVYSLFPKDAVIMFSDVERLKRAAQDLAKTADEFMAAGWHAAAGGQGAGAPISFDKSSFMDFDEVHSALRLTHKSCWDLSSLGVDSSVGGHARLAAVPPEEYRGDEARAAGGIAALRERGIAVTVTAAARGTLSRLKRVAAAADITGLDFALSMASDGFIDEEAKTAILTERDITGHSSAASQVRTPARRRKAIDIMELKKGDYVVHEQHGIGRFVEMARRPVRPAGLSGRGIPAQPLSQLSRPLQPSRPAQAFREYLVIEYAPGKRGAAPDKLYIPTDQLDLISKYIGAEIPKLNKLGGSDWAATKARARKKVREIAQDLVKLYAARQRTAGFAFSPDTPWQHELEEAFPYQETPDQLTTIDEVKADMEKPIPMDRLICGDVGFGKTEIAVRAAFKAIQDSKQVAVLVPTTLLAQQHYETFTERYEGFPVTVKMLSRFQISKESAGTVRGLEDGSVDLVIGTHKLLNPKIKFKDLGLVIIDEEQRFGVEHKETLKALRTNVDVLSLSATPIPRTLEMAVTGIREMSTLATPPEDRLPVLTYVGVYEDAQVAAAVRRELLRGGQVFYVHNRVQDISAIASHIRELVPEARIGIAHGKMGEKQLDTVIRDFWHRDIDVLVCTTIVETGLDISNANTLIVDRADRFGLSQLHQLRGRVGRGRERAYAYFLYDPAKAMTQMAHDRLSTIAQNTALGAGYDVAMKDLEIRGTGNLLGGEQSGHIEGVGFDLYVRMVSDAVQDYKEPERTEAVSTSIDLPVEASIPEDYIGSDKLRLEAYRKIASAHSQDDFADIRDELTDRYGAPPQSLDLLFDVARLRMRARAMGITDIIAQGKNIRVVGYDPKDSVLLRLKRIYKTVQYRPSIHTVIIPAPFHGTFDSAPMDPQEIVSWTGRLLDDLSWHAPAVKNTL